jgi:DNA repair exonuclease SbcCD ATPase subunit
VGTNGSGKSSLVDALSYALFGKAHRNITKVQLINSINAKDMVVEVEFNVANSAYRVVRGQKPTIFEIWKDGVLLNQDSHAKKYQKILEQNIIKHNHKSFHQVEVLGSSSFVPFMQLPTNQRREVIEDLLDINIFSRMNTILKERNSVLKEEMINNKHNLELVNTKTESQTRHIKEIEKITDGVIASKRTEIEELLAEVISSQASMDDIDVTGLEDMRTRSDSFDEQISKIRSYGAVFDKKHAELHKEINFYTDNDVCPTCTQCIDEDFKEVKSNTAASELVKIADGQKKAKFYQADLSVKATHLKELIDAELGKISKIEHHQSNINTAQRRITTVESELQTLVQNNANLDAAHARLAALQIEINNHIDTKLKLVDQREYYLVAAELLKDTGFKTKIIKQYLPVINKFVNSYLQVLDFYVRFDLDESFKETIRSRHRDSFSYDSFSEGEKQRIDLALLFTWRQIAKMKNSVSTNLLILDETFDSSLDDEGVENLIKILDTINEHTNVIVISHNPEAMQDHFDRTLTFSKSNNFSTYNEA